MHLPFCVERCGYCSFNTAPYTPGGLDRFLSALVRECDLAAAAPWARGVTLDTVFLGGGTPSLLDAAQMTQVLAHLGARLALEPSAEVTAECNPDDLTVERLAGYRRAGVTRISLGVQSLDDAVLPRLDRRHSAGQARRAFAAAREAGFDNVSVDLIYGLPGLDLATWTATVREALAWQPDHLSAYALTLDEGSLWHAAGVGSLPSRIPERSSSAGPRNPRSDLGKASSGKALPGDSSGVETRSALRTRVSTMCSAGISPVSLAAIASV